MLEHLLLKLKRDFPTVDWVAGDKFAWDPRDQKVTFDPSVAHPKWSLLHEAGHVAASHQTYKSDVSLLKMEVEAWAKAAKLAAIYGETINKNYVEDCLDSYRDWLHRRSTCPNCSQNGLEQTKGRYHCLNCQHVWEVSEQRFCRVYRKNISLK